LERSEVAGKKVRAAFACGHDAVHCTGEKPKIYFSLRGGRVEFFNFDRDYFRRLQDHDLATENHFVAYFSDLVRIKLRSRLVSTQSIGDIQQETFLRVLTAVRSETGIREPEKLGAFVNSVCNNVLLEFYRASARSPRQEDDLPDLADKTIDLDGFLVSEQTCAHVRHVLDMLSEKDRRLLRAIFLEEKDKELVCREFGVDRDYLRVLLHRAKQSFRTAYEKQTGP
jgi:RNA polymerase sigma-70 factor (ECF subfamily)